MKLVTRFILLISFLAITTTSVALLPIHPHRCRLIQRGKADMGKIYQVSTFQALSEGVYDSDISLKQLAEQGDFGLGALNDLDGEVFADQGRFYRFDKEGNSSLISDDSKFAFAVVTQFKPSIHFTIQQAENFDALGQQLGKQLPHNNVPISIRIHGVFKDIKFRNFTHQTVPYPKLAEVIKNQHVVSLHNVKGTLVGFRFPKYFEDINVPGYHFHLLTDEKKLGGHVLDVNIAEAKVDAQPDHDVQCHLPTTMNFADADLGD